jgi:hypothetical protein
MSECNTRKLLSAIIISTDCVSLIGKTLQPSNNNTGNLCAYTHLSYAFPKILHRSTSVTLKCITDKNRL